MRYKKVLEEGKPFNPFNMYHGIFIPSGLIESTLNDSIKILMGRLLQYSGKNGKAYPYRTTLAKECGWELRKLDRVIRQAKNIKLIKTTPHITENPVDNPPNEYIFLYSKIYDGHDEGADKNDSRGTVKSDKQNKIIKNKIIKRFINKSNDSAESTNKTFKPLINNRKLVKISKTKTNTIKHSQTTIEIKAKYNHSSVDLRNYMELTNSGIGITKHNISSKARIITIDKLHALFSNKCKNPYHEIDVPKKYVDYKWDIDELIEVFKYHTEQCGKYGKKKIGSIGTFILSEGFNGVKSWSPLIYWHQKMNKTAEGELTEEGKKLLSSLKRAKVDDIVNLDSSIINKVSKELFQISNKYVFIDGNTVTMSYPFGIVDVLSKYIKEKTNNYKFKLVYITKEGFVSEFISIAKERNILKKKINGRSVFA